MNNTFFLITIIRREDAAEYERFYSRHDVNIVYALNCNGTAREHTLDLLGIARSEKSMLMTAVSASQLRELTHSLSLEMKIDLPDRGVAMAIPIASIGAHTLQYLVGNEIQTETENNDMHSDYELIVAIYEKGFTETVMDAARAAGARGGTTIKALGTGAKAAEKFFGISLAEEKEIVFIVTDTAKKKDIMMSIMQGAGIGTKAHALVFSLPVSDVAGFRFADMVDKDAE